MRALSSVSIFKILLLVFTECTCGMWMRPRPVLKKEEKFKWRLFSVSLEKSWSWQSRKSSLRRIPHLWHFWYLFFTHNVILALVMNPLKFQNLTKRNPANIASNFSLIASSLKQEKKNTKIAEKQIDLCALKNPKSMKTTFLQNF